MKKRYGDTRTNLTLTATAQKVYDETDPLDIYEFEVDVENGDEIETEYRYDLNFAGDKRTNLTADEVNAYLETMFGEIYAQ